MATAPLARHLRVGRPATRDVRRGERLVARERAGVALLTARPELEATLRSRSEAKDELPPFNYGVGLGRGSADGGVMPFRRM